MTTYLFKCTDCNKEYIPSEVEYLCPSCSATQRPMEPLMGVLRTVYDYANIANNFEPKKLSACGEKSFERWKEILPLENADHLPPLITDFTPLRTVSNLRRELKLNNLWIKDDTVMPTASFKDRASALVVACARERERDTVVAASTGNAATALSGQAASVGLKSVIFVPETAPKAKLAQIAIFGSTLIPIKGTYDEAFELSIKATGEFGWYNRNTAYNPFTIEGKKTAALEIWEQLGFSVPDWVIIPTGDGVILAGIYKGFWDLKAMGFIEKLPRLVAVQAAGCNPIMNAWKSGKEIEPILKPHTIADSISVGVPRAGRWTMKALKETNGVCEDVTDEEIIRAIAFLGRTTGVFAEPAAATSIAGLMKLIGNNTIEPHERVVALITGSGLKDVQAASKAVEIPSSIKPDIESVKKLLKQI